MHRIPLPSTDWYLLLTPGWGQWSVVLQMAWSALLLLVPVGLVVWLYRYELRLVRGFTALFLLSLRLLVLVLLWFLVCLQPILARTVTEQLPGRVLVAVDRSDSMSVADPQRPAVEKLRLARAFNLAAGVPAPLLEDWIRQYDAHATITDWVAATEHAGEPERRQQLVEARRRLHDEICRQIDTLSRGELARRVLVTEGVGLVPALAGRHRLELLGFARETWDVQPAQLEELFRSTKETNSAVQPAGLATAFSDLGQPLSRALERAGPERGPILGLVLLSDGQHNWGETPARIASKLDAPGGRAGPKSPPGASRFPIYPVALGARQAPPDVALAGVRAPSAVFKGVDTAVEARIKVSSLKTPQDIVVEMQVPGEPAALKEIIRHDGTDRSYPVRFQARLDQVGTQTLTVTVQPVPGEVRSDNNRLPLVVNVADDKAKVLLVDGEARWEFHYLANALARDRTVQLQSIVFAQPRIGKIDEAELRKAGQPLQALPPEPDALAEQDCIILGDVSPAQLPLTDRVRLEKFVAERGGTLVIVAGKRAMPLGYLDRAADPPVPQQPAGPSDPEEPDPLLRLLPIVDPRPVRSERGFPLRLTHEGQLAQFLMLEPTAEKSEERWAELPHHFWGVVGRPKPGAVALAYEATTDPVTGKTDEGARAKEHALIVRQNYGFGRVVFVGLDSTWRWRYRTGDLYHHRFWGQLLRWAASDKPLVAGNEHVRFGSRAPAYRQGQEVELVIRLGEETPDLKPDALAGARILRAAGAGQPEQAVALVPLGRREGQPRVLEGRLRDVPPGQYVIELAIPELADRLMGPPGPDGQPSKLRAPFTVVPSESEEMVELATNWPLLEDLAQKSGGQVFAPEDARALVDLLAARSVTHEYRIETKVWQWWLPLAVFLTLLTVEWVVRKLAGLP